MGWISVKYKLPEHEIPVLVFIGNIVNMGWFDKNLKKFIVYGGIGNNTTHWMPLPQPPTKP